MIAGPKSGGVPRPVGHPAPRRTARRVLQAAVALACLGGLAGKVAAQAPTVTGVTLNSPSADSKVASEIDTFWWSETIRVSVTFSEAVEVTGMPRVQLGIGTCTDCYAEYASGTGTPTLVFAYDVVRGDADADGLSIASNALSLNGGSIRAVSGGGAADLGLGTHAITNSANHKVGEGASTGIVNILQNSPANGDTYQNGETIWVTLVFSRLVRFRGSIQSNAIKVRLTIGDQVRLMDYSSGHPGTQWAFRYIVRPNDMDLDGYSITGRALIGASISRYVTRNVGRQAIVNSSSHKVDGRQGPPGVVG